MAPLGILEEPRPANGDGLVETLFDEIMAEGEREAWLSGEHFPVDGTLERAVASHKSFRPRDGGHDEPPVGGRRNADERRPQLRHPRGRVGRTRVRSHATGYLQRQR